CMPTKMSRRRRPEKPPTTGRCRACDPGRDPGLGGASCAPTRNPGQAKSLCRSPRGLEMTDKCTRRGATGLQLQSAEDRSVYLALLQRLGENMASTGGLLGSEVRSLALVRHTIGLVRGGGLHGAECWLRAAVTSGRAYLRRDFRGNEVDHL